MKELDKDSLPEDLRKSHEIICKELQTFAEHGVESSFLSFGYRLTTGKVEARELAAAKEEGARESLKERIGNIEQTMAAWSAYKTPLYFYNGREKTEEEWNGIFSNHRIVTDETTSLKHTDRYEMGISFPEFLMEYIDKKGE